MHRLSPLLLALCLAACGAGTIHPGNLVDTPTGSTGGAGTGGTGAGASTGSTGTGAGGGTAGGLGAPTSPNFIFSPYKDVTISANWNTNVISTAVTGTMQPVTTAAAHVPAVSWAFATGECGSETWGGINAGQLATANVAAWSSAGIKYILSTGGADGTFTCGSDANFAAFIDRYASPQLAGVDFDIEGGQSQAQLNDLAQRVKTAQANPKYANLRFSFTIATLGGNANQSLGAEGVLVMNAIKSAGLDTAIINLMTMDYGSAIPANCTVSNGNCEMGQSAVQAAQNFQSAYNVPYSQIELTPMIGGNDTQGETFTLGDVNTVTSFALQQKLAGVHIWSLDRDKDCPPGSASATCNSFGAAGSLGFTGAFLNNL